MQDKLKPPTFPNLPQSALLSKLEAFLPVMAEENKKLSDAVAAGEGAKHNIEVEEAEDRSDDDSDEPMTGGSEEDTKPKKGGKAPVIEMNFALSMMDEGNSDDENAETAVDPEAQTKVVDSSLSAKKEQQEQLSFRMRLEKPSNKPRPVIQELN
ncbi:hypothetical protein GN244_ATG18720 [Phytophthora infestans]|uniref:Uncharacterized protein n=1 Tax=Phytophthora infestans TaxID=4787 RepID=A0A833VUP1_PHYIN|nr:hypothetical protein GN244_ATG18720 [Phytophthora infestans]KAF4128319.1 hypothetical protein GN958_ATG22491 [Phytophthora infestans]KAI9979713.1 hypothetical protein PInf_028055 [Phytophthora infestans]KAI9987297.1 hypothetical protein PInf_023292 [Phytophthora infestans]